MSEDDPQKQLDDAIARILASTSRKKLIVAGPGAGKTTLFKMLLERSAGDRKSRLVLTFINNLRNDLDKDLGELASVFTLHGYCQSLLHKIVNGKVRNGLSSSFKCLPGLASLIKKDWKYLNGEPAPRFVELMRDLAGVPELEFYILRSNYYDAVDFDDSVYRVYRGLKNNPDRIETYDLVLIDEYQDFNRLEAGLIDLLAEKSPVVIAGDDDQALYSQLKGASSKFIRDKHEGGDFEVFELPYCMRCAEVIVRAVNDVVEAARTAERLEGRIDKPYLPFEPVKGADSKKYPHIDLVRTSVQNAKANYFGKYIAQQITVIPKEEIEQAQNKGEPVVLIIGSKPYLPQVAKYLKENGFKIEEKEAEHSLDETDGHEILADDPESNLGWRVMLEFESEGLVKDSIRSAAEKDGKLIDVLSEELKTRILADVDTWKLENENAAKVKTEGTSEAETKSEDQTFRIKLTSFEGSKGLSAQHVFILGMHEGEFPKDRKNIKDIEICRFLVGLTRAKKKCTLLLTKFFATASKKPSVFLNWIHEERFNVTEVDAKYWKS